MVFTTIVRGQKNSIGRLALVSYGETIRHAKRRGGTGQPEQCERVSLQEVCKGLIRKKPAPDLIRGGSRLQQKVLERRSISPKRLRSKK